MGKLLNIIVFFCLQKIWGMANRGRMLERQIMEGTHSVRAAPLADMDRGGK